MAQPPLEEQIKSATSYAEEMANLATEKIDSDIQTPEMGEIWNAIYAKAFRDFMQL